MFPAFGELLIDCYVASIQPGEGFNILQYDLGS